MRGVGCFFKKHPTSFLQQTLIYGLFAKLLRTLVSGGNGVDGECAEAAVFQGCHALDGASRGAADLVLKLTGVLAALGNECRRTLGGLDGVKESLVAR